MRLSSAVVSRLPADVARPGYDRERQRPGIVHLGIGAFHRAHQAAYTDAAMAAGDRDWAITGVSLRSPQVHDQLAPQDGLYTLTERGAAGDRTRLIGAVSGVMVAGRDADAVRRLLASADTRLVTLTVTEKGYWLGPDATLDIAAVQAAGGTIYHHIARAVIDRRDAGLPPLTLMSCDNLPANGGVLRSAVAAFLDRVAPAYRRWFDRDWACPSTMVDRIVPATTAEDRDRLYAATGIRDEGAVVTEPFSQWVIEDGAYPRPRWEVAGAQFVADVRPFETAKLRMLNGAHSALAYLGIAAGHRFVHEAAADRGIRPLVRRLMREEAAASVEAAPGQDLARYADALLARFDNAALPHRLAQIASDGSQKIGPRWIDAIRINRAQGRSSPATLGALSAWVDFVRQDRPDSPDPLSEQLRSCWAAVGESGIVDALFGGDGPVPARWMLAEEDRRALGDMRAGDR